MVVRGASFGRRDGAPEDGAVAAGQARFEGGLRGLLRELREFFPLRVDLGVHPDLQRVAARVLGQEAAQVGAPVERVRDAGARCLARVLAVARGPLQPVGRASQVAPHQHVGGVRRQVRSRRRLEEAVSRPELVGADEVEQLPAWPPPRVLVHGHRHGGRAVRIVAAGAFDVDADPLQTVAERVGTGRESLRHHLVGAAGGDVAVVGLAQVLDHRVQRLAVEGHERMVQIYIPASAGEAHARRRRIVNAFGCGACNAG